MPDLVHWWTDSLIKSLTAIYFLF